MIGKMNLGKKEDRKNIRKLERKHKNMDNHFHIS